MLMWALSRNSGQTISSIARTRLRKEDIGQSRAVLPQQQFRVVALHEHLEGADFRSVNQFHAVLPSEHLNNLGEVRDVAFTSPIRLAGVFCVEVGGVSSTEDHDVGCGGVNICRQFAQVTMHLRRNVTKRLITKVFPLIPIANCFDPVVLAIASTVGQDGLFGHFGLVDEFGCASGEQIKPVIERRNRHHRDFTTRVLGAVPVQRDKETHEEVVKVLDRAPRDGDEQSRHLCSARAQTPSAPEILEEAHAWKCSEAGKQLTGWGFIEDLVICLSPGRNNLGGMASGVYVTAAEGFSGKSTIALGLIDALAGSVSTIGVFRPVARSGNEPDYVLELLLSHDAVELDYADCVGVSYDDVHKDPDAAMSEIVRKYRLLESRCDSIVVLGSDYTDVGNPTEFEFNAEVATNLGIPVVLVVTGRDPAEQAHRGLAGAPARASGDIVRVAQAALGEIRDAHAEPVAVIVNRAEPDQMPALTDALQRALPGLLIGCVPEDRVLVAPTVSTVIDAVGGQLVQGDAEALSREALGVMVAAMGLETVLERLQEGFLVLVPGDRYEILLGVVMAHQSENFPSLAGMVLYGGVDTPDVVFRLVSGLKSGLPIISSQAGTYETVLQVTGARGRMAADSQRKYDTALAVFRDNVDTEALLASLDVAKSSVVTPLMFEYDLLERARTDIKHIVLPEGHDDRIIRAAATLLTRGVVKLTLLGDEQVIRSRASELGLSLDGAQVLSPVDEVLRERFAQEYFRLREHKGMTLEAARDVVTDVSYFGTMMVHLGLADGMVSGAANTTAHTITPSFQIIKTKPGVSVVSSVFFMCLADRVLVYGDCAVVPDPTTEQLADIAASAADTAAQFGIEPRVAMLSYSTGESGSGADVDKVRSATALLREKKPELPIEGPIQYDAAAEPTVAQTKMPDSQVAGRATVFVFPDLNTGNNTYKAVQRSAGAIAIGPVLQGLNKPVNDLSRGATVRDIVNTVAITAIQAQGVEGTTR